MLQCFSKALKSWATAASFRTGSKGKRWERSKWDKRWGSQDLKESGRDSYWCLFSANRPTSTKTQWFKKRLPICEIQIEYTGQYHPKSQILVFWVRIFHSSTTGLCWSPMSLELKRKLGGHRLKQFLLQASKGSGCQRTPEPCHLMLSLSLSPYKPPQ